MGYMENVHAMLARWAPDSLADQEEVLAVFEADAPRFALVEESRISGEHVYSFGDGFAAMLQDADSDEYAGDWTPLAVVDVEGGVVFPLEVTRVTVASKIHASHGLRHVN